MKRLSMKMARVILFTGQMDVMSTFYGEVLGLRQVTNEEGWREFDAGGAHIALHSGPASPGRKGPDKSLPFYHWATINPVNRLEEPPDAALSCPASSSYRRPRTGPV